MKCRFCGAEIKTGSNVCEYCGSEAEGTDYSTQTIENAPKAAKSVAGIIGKVIISLACIWAAVIIITLVVVLNSDAFKETYESSSNTSSVYELSKNRTGMTGRIISCDENGVASVEYKNYIYEDVKILDTDLLEWLKEINKTLDNIGICFATDKNGDISELGLLSADFFIMEKESSRYIAIRGEQVMSFTSDTPLEIDHCYTGYFCYPDVRLYWGKETSPWAMAYMDPKCENKESPLEQDVYSGEDITVYKLLVEGQWYYCSKKTYDTVNVGDLLNGYELYSNEDTAYIWKEQISLLNKK